jgi:hypothetical protein
MSEERVRPLSAEAASIPPGHRWRRLPLVAGVFGAMGLMLAFLLTGRDPHQLYPAYLAAYVYFATLALGALFFVLLHHLTRAGWSVLVRRLAEHMAMTLPLFALLFVPIALGVGHLYHWAEPGAAAHDPILAGKQGYLESGFFTVRAAIYLLAWTLLAWWFRRGSIAQDSTDDPAPTRRLQTLSAPSMIVFALTLSFAAFDWVMSLDPHWYSTIFGVYVFAGCAVAIYAALALVAILAQRAGILTDQLDAEHYHDLGKMLFAFVVFWAYIGFSQYMLIWYANIPEETEWFAHRLEGGWLPATVALVVGHFGLPFFVLLSRKVKRRKPLLAAAAVWMLAMHGLDVFWLVMPASSPAGPRLHPADLLCFVGVGGLFLACFGLAMRRRALVPVGDPRLPESLSFENM